MRWLVTGGAGFIGTNVVAHLMERGNDVVIVDDLSRSGSEINAAFLGVTYGLEVNRIDISRENQLQSFLEDNERFDVIAHAAGQVSLLASIADPRRDFEINALGTLNILEHVRLHSPETAVIGMSSNKVYGDLVQVKFVEEKRRFIVPDYPNGFNEDMPLAFHGPYGCSKGTADQYLLDYGRMFNLRTVSLRESSVYGPHQHPRSDQGWVAHLLEEAVAGHPIQLNGIGKQVRDLLHVTDLARLFVALAEALEPGAPQAVNVGGGAENSLSILEFFDWIARETGIRVDFRTGPARPRDQLVYISDLSAVRALTGWKPEVSIETGLQALLASTAV